MPKVAQYQPNQVLTQTVRQPRAQNLPASAFVNPVGQGLVDIAQAGVRVKQRVDTTSAEEALVQFERDKNDLFFNPDSGYFNTQGRNAYDNAGTVNKSLEELKAQYGESLGQNSRLMFDKVADNHITRGQQDVARHSAKGLQVWEIATIDSQVESTLENASLYWNDDDRLKVQNITGRLAVIESSEMMGIGPEATAEKLQNYESSFAKLTIEAAISNSSSDGKASLGKYGDMLEGPDKINIEKAIEQKSKIEKTQMDARASVLTASRLVDQYDSRQGVIDEVNNIDDPDLRKKTMTESMAQFSRKRQAEKEQEAEYYNEGIEAFNKGGTAGVFEAQNPEAWEGMSSSQRNNLLAGRHMTTDQIKFNNVLSLPRSQLAKVEPAEYADVFSPADVSKLRSSVDKAKKGQSITTVQSAATKTNLIAEQFFGKKSSWKGNKSKTAKVQALMTAVQGSIEDAEESKGGKLTPTEVDDVMADFSRRFVVERSAFGFDLLASDLDIDLSTTPPEQVAELSRLVDASGEEFFQSLISKLKELDKPITVDTILNTYRQAAR